MTQQIGQPFAVLHVGFAARDGFDVLSIDQREVRGKHQFRLRAHRTLGATVISTGTHQDQLPNRAKSTKMPRSRLAGSPAQYATFSSASLSGTDIALPNHATGPSSPGTGIATKPIRNSGPKAARNSCLAFSYMRRNYNSSPPSSLISAYFPL